MGTISARPVTALSPTAPAPMAADHPILRTSFPEALLLGWLLRIANSYPTAGMYALKERVLIDHGAFVRHDWQYIEKPCWGCSNCNDDEWDRTACSGDGVYSRTWVKHEVRRLACFFFHIPVLRTSSNPGDVPIWKHGTVKKEGSYYDDSAEACMWLALLIDPACWWWNLTSASYPHQPVGWRLMLRLKLLWRFLRNTWNRLDPRPNPIPF